MPDTYYKDALRAGQREYRECVVKGAYPYLSVLEDFVPADRMAIGVDLGLVQVPAELIVGTRTRGRTNAFARNFMPLLEGGTEFSHKWESLCQAHVTEGIRDPVTVCEYLNRYYVVEGNKRVSVLKYFGAVSVPAMVTRILPERTEQNEIYYEFIEFYRLSQLNLLELSKRGSYEELQALLGKEPGEAWSEEEQRRFRAAYFKFRTAFGGERKPPRQVGDALLTYIRVYGYQALLQHDSAALKREMAKIREEVELQQEGAPIELKAEPAPAEQPKKQNLLTKVLSKEKTLRAAFLYDRTPAASGWNMAHELGRRYVQRVFQEEIVTSAYENVLEKDPDKLVEQVVEDGNTVLFTTSPRLLPLSLRTAVERPELVVMNCSLNTSHRYIRTYYARMYEVKFIAGAIAGVMARDGQVGYICDYPIYGQIAGVNAFALGMQMVNPTARLALEWSSIDGLDAATRRLEERGIRLISSLDMAALPSMEHNGVGLSMDVGGKRKLLAIPVWKWGVYYEEMLRRIMTKTVQSEYKSSRKALNYYWGIGAGVLDLYCTELVPRSVQRLVDILKSGIAKKVVYPFAGQIYLPDGRIVGSCGEELSLDQIANMDYLVDGVDGAIPTYDQLSDVGRATVDLVGIPSAAKGGARREG